jgi:hypothetical protein
MLLGVGGRDPNTFIVSSLVSVIVACRPRAGAPVTKVDPLISMQSE